MDAESGREAGRAESERSDEWTVNTEKVDGVRRHEME